MVKSFNSFADLDDLLENTLYTTPAERDTLLKDKSRVATIFVTNFFGTLGLINALKPAQKKTVINFLRKDKRVQVANISDDNHDISLSLKLASEADFFISSITATEISKFLFKLKSGQIDTIDSAVAAKWANGLKPDFALSLKDPYIRSAFIDFRDNGGTTVDISRLAVIFKRRINKLPDGGDFKRFAKRFFGLTEVQIGQPAAAATTAAPAVAATAVATAAPAKLSYYQRQKLKKQQAAQAATQPTAQPAPADDAGLKAQVDAENAAGKKVDERKITGDGFNKMIDLLFKFGSRGGFGVPATMAANKMAEFATKNQEDQPKYANLALELITEVHNKLIITYIANDENTFTVLGDDILEAKRKLLNIKKEYINLVADIPGAVGFEQYLSGFVDMVGTSSSYSKHIARGLYAQLLLGYPLNDYRNNYTLTDSAYLLMTLELVQKMPGAYTQPFKDVYYDTLKKADDRFIKDQLQKVFSYILQPKPQANVLGTFGSAQLAATIALDYVRHLNKDFDFMIESVGDWMKTAISKLMVRFLVKGYDTFDEDYGIEMNNIPFLKLMVEEYFDDIKSSYNNQNNTMVSELIQYLAGEQFKLKDITGLLPDFIKKEIVDDLKVNTIEDSNLSRIYKLGPESYKFTSVARMLDLDLKDLLKKNPTNGKLLRAAIETDGPESYTIEQIALALSERTITVHNVAAEATYMINKVGRDKADKIVHALATIFEKDPQRYNKADIGQRMLSFLPDVSSDTVVKMMTIARDSNMPMLIGPPLYNALAKGNKQMYVDCLTGVIQDAVGTPVEEYVNGIIEDLPPHVVQKMRGNLVGAQVLIDEINKGQIQPFDKIDNNRLKKIFQYNDIDMSQLVGDVVEKKKKNETYTEYFKRALQAVAAKNLLEKEKVALDDKANKKEINRIMISRDHAGKHGDTYPKILKVYNAKLEYPEFEQFRKNNFGDGTVVPAYHGTGGIAAGMILRYGFKVIKSSDPSVTGRMLGDGIYFSNKIDKVLQYVSNSGYSRNHGQKGYIMEMDVNLGKRPKDYQAAGLGNDSIRSPEWCVRDPKAQTRVIKVYEVELNSRRNVDDYLKEDYNNRIMSFKQHLREQTLAPTSSNQMGFIFRDGMIPIINENFEGEFTAVDFEEALKDKLITEDMFEVTGQGPMIVFRNTDQQKIVDLRYNWQLSGSDLDDYVRLFQEKMRPL